MKVFNYQVLKQDLKVNAKYARVLKNKILTKLFIALNVV